jgi:cation:H+ antiporter
MWLATADLQGGKMDTTLLELFGSMIIVLFAAVIFVNAVEYIGYKLNLGHSFVGAIIAPLFTSIPELTVFLVAVFAVGQTAGQEVGIGTLFGQPFMASSLSYGLVGLAAVVGFFTGRRKGSFLVVERNLGIPYVFIAVLFPLTVVPSLLAGVTIVKYAFGLLFFGAFLLYVWMMFRRREEGLIEEVEDCYLYRYGGRIIRMPMISALIQIVISAVGLYVGSEGMVDSVIAIANSIKMSPLGLALILVPAATAIPETTSALIWGYRGKDTLSLGSLVGESVLYSTFYPAIGLFLTPWALDRHAYSSVLATTIVSLVLLMFIMRKKMPWWSLCLGLFFFAAYATLVFAFQF